MASFNLQDFVRNSPSTFTNPRQRRPLPPSSPPRQYPQIHHVQEIFPQQTLLHMHIHL